MLVYYSLIFIPYNNPQMTNCQASQRMYDGVHPYQPTPGHYACPLHGCTFGNSQREDREHLRPPGIHL